MIARPAKLQLNEILRYIAAEGRPAAAERVAARLLSAAQALTHFPQIGRRISADTYELVTVNPYIIRYRVTATTVRVLRIRHGAMRRN